MGIIQHDMRTCIYRNWPLPISSYQLALLRPSKVQDAFAAAEFVGALVVVEQHRYWQSGLQYLVIHLMLQKLSSDLVVLEH